MTRLNSSISCWTILIDFDRTSYECDVASGLRVTSNDLESFGFDRFFDLFWAPFPSCELVETSISCKTQGATWLLAATDTYPH